MIIVLVSGSCSDHQLERGKPNIILVMTDDQGYGDLGSHGNSVIRVPHLDRFANESLEMTRFYVDPLCSPTRASLMTGRYHFRTGVLHTSRGGAKMSGEEVTLAELLSETGYATGIFGKWHLGDNFPMRPQDQGFKETLIHRSGGISQVPDSEGDYFEPILWQNGERLQAKKYCTDVFFDAAINFIGENQDKPFFIYLPTNVPHGPFQVDEKYSQAFIDQGLREKTAMIYGMLKNFDENFGRLLETLDLLELEDNTIVIFMTDNGPIEGRYNAGLRGSKGQVYEGGIRVPFFVRWPHHIRGTQKTDRVAAHIDLVPTLLAAAGGSVPADLTLDGRNLLPLWKGQVEAGQWPDRTLYVQFNKGMVKQPYQNAAVWNQRYKMVLNPGSAFDAPFILSPNDYQIELYDIESDPQEAHNVAASNMDVVKELRSLYEGWFGEMKNTRSFQPRFIHLDPEAENPVLLCRYHDANHLYHNSEPGGWPLRLSRSGTYRISIINSSKNQTYFSLDEFWENWSAADLVMEWDNNINRVALFPGGNSAEFHLLEDEGILDAYIEVGPYDQRQQIRKGEVLVEYIAH